MDAQLVIGVVTALVAVPGVYFAYLTVPAGRLPRRPRWRIRAWRHRRVATAPATPTLPEGNHEVFISHTASDAPIAERLASGLQSSGLRVFLAQWVTPGLVTSLEADQALRTISHGILLFSESTQQDPRVMDDYAAALQRVHTAGQRLVPVLVGHIHEQNLPPLIRIRQPLDLRDATSAKIDCGARQLASLIRRDLSQRPFRHS
ncbi:MAG: hypothetical protein QG608_205 [Actinomycetota bacterium]|nr:hypothetical protein [Actinomycetota bacterium]